MKPFYCAVLLSTAFALSSGCKKEPAFVHHEDLPPNMEKIYFFVQDEITKKQIAGADIQFLNSFGQAVFEGRSKADKPWDYAGVGAINSGFTIHDTTVEIKKAGYTDFKMAFKEIPCVGKAKGSFEVYATLQKQ